MDHREINEIIRMLDRPKNDENCNIINTGIDIELKKFTGDTDTILEKLAKLNYLQNTSGKRYKSSNIGADFQCLLMIARELTNEQNAYSCMSVEYYDGLKFKERNNSVLPRWKNNNNNIVILFMFGCTKQFCISKKIRNELKNIEIPAGLKHKDILIIKNTSGWKGKILKRGTNSEDESFVVKIFGSRERL